MLSYVPYDEIGLGKGKTRGKDVLKLLDTYYPPHGSSERKLKYIRLLRESLESERYGSSVFAFFRKERDALNDKQFQAICILLNQNLYISFCGTDATTLGWKEDFNMSFLETVPSEVEAAKYVNFIASKFWFRKIYLGINEKFKYKTRCYIAWCICACLLVYEKKDVLSFSKNV